MVATGFREEKRNSPASLKFSRFLPIFPVRMESTEMNISTRNQEQKPPLPRAARCEVKLPVEVTHHVFVGARSTQGVCTDLNGYGFGADIPQPLSVGEVVKVALDLPSDRLSVFARVVYRNGYHYGFYFVEIEAEQRSKLEGALCLLQNVPTMAVQ